MNTHNDKNNDPDTFVNDNPDTAHPLDNNQKDDSSLDASVNTNFTEESDGKKSLTIDEDADTDPNEVANKPTFKNDNH